MVLQSHQPLGCPKVGDLELASVHVDQNIVSFDVPVHNPLVMEVLQTLHNLPCVVLDSGLIILQGTPLVLQQGRQTPWGRE